MARKPLIAGNWKMNLNHFEAIALVQKIAFSLPDKYFDKVDVTVIPPFTDLRSVQTLVDGDKLRLTYGAQDLSPARFRCLHRRDQRGVPGQAGLHASSWSATPSGGTYHNEDDALVPAKAAAALRHGLTPIVCIGEQLEVREAGRRTSSTTSNSCVARWPGCPTSSSPRSSSPTSRCGPSAPGGWPARPTRRKSAGRSAPSWPSWRRRRSQTVCGCSTAVR